MASVELNRRKFLVTSTAFAGGMSLALLSGCSGGNETDADAKPMAADGEAELHAWVMISADDTVTVRVPTPEIGNGSSTQVAANVTEELGCDWAHVKIEPASPRRDYLEDGVYTVGGQAFFSGHGTDHERMHYALQLGASARERLKAAAASQWGVPVNEISAADSILTHNPTGRTLRYGEMADAAAGITLDTEPALKPQSEWSFLGKNTFGRHFVPDVVKGTAVYGIDVKVPGMVHAALMQSPVQGGRLKSHDPSAVQNMPGVRAVVVVDPDKTPGSPVPPKAPFGLETTGAQSAVAVIADHYWQAKKALEALPVEWDYGFGTAWDTTEQIYDAAEALLDRDAGRTTLKRGDVDAVTAAQELETTYLTPFCDHVQMEPLNGTARVSKDRVDVWHPAQDQQQAFWVAIDESGMAPENVYIHQTLVGGAFGRRSYSEDVRMVVAVARQYPDVPVKVIWSREEAVRQGRYRTLIANRFKAGLNEDGRIEAFNSQVVFGGLALSFGIYDSPYLNTGVIPNVRLTNDDLTTHILTGAYRAPCYNSHVFMLESFVDECAAAAGIDPLEYRRHLLSEWDPAWTKVLDTAAEKAGWGRALPKGEGLGIAISNWPKAGLRQAGATIAAAAHVEVSRNGALQVKQIDVTFDCGRIANKDLVAAQLEGGTFFGLNACLNEEITIKDGAVVEANYDTYPVQRMADVPTVNIHFDALSGHDRFAIIGEAPVGPVQAAVGNAIYQATGKRLRTTPFRKHDLSWS